MAIFIEKRGAGTGPPRTHRNEFPAGYSLTRCSPAERASASPADLILHKRIPFVKENPANGSCRIYSLSHERAQSTSSTGLNRLQQDARICLKPKQLKTGS
jgi:hypothetical protein